MNFKKYSIIIEETPNKTKERLTGDYTKIDGNTIIFNSDFQNYEDEENGKKPNTQRLLNREEYRTIRAWWGIKGTKYIEIHEIGFKLLFKRTLTDVRSVGELLGKHEMVFSWKHEETIKTEKKEE